MTEFDCIAALKALGEGTRLRILRLLFNQALSVNEISERPKVSQYNVSKHLRIMREAGLLELEKSGKQRLYAVTRSLKSQRRPTTTCLISAVARSAWTNFLSKGSEL